MSAARFPIDGPGEPNDPTIVALILAEVGQFRQATDTAWQARAVADRVVIAIPEADDRLGAEDLLAPGCTVLTGDWQSDDGTARLIEAAAGALAVVLGAGERLRAASWTDARRELTSCDAGGLALRIGERVECRVGWANARFAELIGAEGMAVATTIDVLAAPTPVPVTTIPTGIARTPLPPAGLEPAERLLAGLPPHLRSAAALADAVCGADPAAAERLAEVLERYENRRMLELSRAGRDVCWAEAADEDEPLVTIRIPTYNRGPLVAERAIASAVAQSYERLEILVIGDHCDDETAKAVRGCRDRRVRFVNLAQRGLYPEDAQQRWLVAGTSPVNAAMDLARGAWIAPCDDDDELTPDHVETLLGAAKDNRLEFVWSKARMEVEAGRWGVVGNGHFAEGFISHGTVLFSAGLRFFRYRGSCWKLGEPGDWNLWKRMADAGVKMGFADAVTYVHYLETPKRSAVEGAEAA